MPPLGGTLSGLVCAIGTKGDGKSLFGPLLRRIGLRHCWGRCFAGSKEHRGVAGSDHLGVGTESIFRGEFVFEIADGSVGLDHPSLHLSHHVRASFGPVMIFEHLREVPKVLFGNHGNGFGIAAWGVSTLAHFTALPPHRPDNVPPCGGIFPPLRGGPNCPVCPAEADQRSRF